MNSLKEYKGFKDLIVFQKAYKLSLDIFEITNSFPKEEKYSLVDQVRRSSRSVCTNIAEAWSKRKYPKLFISKLVDSAGETAETEVWIDFSFDHKYISEDQKNILVLSCNEVGKMLSSMIKQPEKFCF